MGTNPSARGHDARRPMPLGCALVVLGLLTLAVTKPARSSEPPIVHQPPRLRPTATAEMQVAAPPAAAPSPSVAAPAPDAAPSGEDAASSETDEFSDLPCVLLPRPGCGTQAHVDLGMGWGESHSYVGTQWSYRGSAEAGMLVGVDREWQIGPALEAAFDLGRVTSGWGFVPKVKSRYWIGGWYISLDGALGWSLERFSFDHGTEAGTRMGLQADLGLTVLGLIGPFVHLSALGDPDGIGGSETRWLVGFRAGVLSWAALLSGFGGMGSGFW